MTPTNGTGPGAVPAKRGGPPAWLFAIGAGGLAVATLLLVLGILGIGVRVGSPPTTLPPTSEMAAGTQAQVVAALEAASLQVREPLTAYRPGESPSLLDVPRRLVQVVLPSDPQGGYVVIYELPTNGDADRVGRDFLAYLASGTGAVQYPRDTRFVVRRLGPTLVFYHWSPETSPDAAGAIAAALANVGETIRP